MTFWRCDMNNWMSTLEYGTQRMATECNQYINCIQKFSKKIIISNRICELWGKAIRDGMTSSLNSILDNAAKDTRLKHSNDTKLQLFLHENNFTAHDFRGERKTAHSFSIVVFLLFLPRLASHTMEMELLYNVKNIFI